MPALDALFADFTAVTHTLPRVVALASLLIGASRLDAQPAARAAALHRLAGCYRLTLGPWSGALPATGLPAAQTPPSRFRLDTAAVVFPTASGYAVEPRALVERVRPRVRPGSWRPIGGDSLVIAWSTGFTGVVLRVAARRDSLVGRARVFDDVQIPNEPPDPEASVVAVRIRCEGTLRGPELRPSPVRPPLESLVGEFPDDHFASIADSVQGFAGILMAGDTLVLMLVDPARRVDAEAAVQTTLGPRRYRHVAVRPAQYDFRQLRDWKDLARRTSVSGWSSLDADERRNRIVVGVRDSTYVRSARRALEAAGIPAGAIVVEVAAPAMPFGGVERAASHQPAPRFVPVQPDLFSLGGSFVNAWADYDRDGDIDLFVGFNGTANRLYRNDRGVFTDVAAAAGVADARATRAAAWGDYDADGDPDLVLGFAPGRESVLRLYRNDRGHFTDATADVGLARDSGAVRQLALVDVDGDDDLDLFVAFRDRANALFRNENGRFRDVAPEIGLADTRRTVGAVWLDYDEDGDLDLYVGNMDGDANGLFRNDGGRFNDVAADAGVAWGGRLANDPTNGTVRPCAADVDGDGRHDLFTANYGKNGLSLNRGRGRFEDASATWGVDVDARYDSCAFADFDNDGRLDVYVNGTVTGGVSYRDYLFRNTGERFEDITPDNLRALQADHGVQWADFDGDGDVDLSLTGARPDGMHSLLRNLLPATDASRSIQIRVLDAAGRATRAGAEVRLFAVGTRRLIAARLVDSGSGYDSQNDIPVHFGLATLERVDVEVIWPAGARRVSTWRRRVDPREWNGRVLVVRTQK